MEGWKDGRTEGRKLLTVREKPRDGDWGGGCPTLAFTLLVHPSLTAPESFRRFPLAFPRLSGFSRVFLVAHLLLHEFCMGDGPSPTGGVPTCQEA